MIKTILRPAAIAVRPLVEPLLDGCCRLTASFTAFLYSLLFQLQWRVPPMPAFFDHRIDMFVHWPQRRNAAWVERAVFSGFVLQGGDVLELGCGDGFFTRNCYSLRSRHIVACDIDERAIRNARRRHPAENVEYRLLDIRGALPEGPFNNIIWDTAMDYLTRDEIAGVLRNVKSVTLPSSVISGHVRGEGEFYNHAQRYGVAGKSDLRNILAPHFKNVTVFQTDYPDRVNLYFWASDSPLGLIENPAWTESGQLSR